VCATVSELAAVVWLKNPVGSPDLPRKIIMAECYSALEPDDQLWREYLIQVDEIQASGRLPEDEYVFLRYSVEAKRAVTDIALEEGFEMSPGSVAEVLRRARETANREARDQLRSVERSAAEREASFSCQIKDLRIALSEQALAERRRRQRDLARLQTIADWIGRLVYWSILGVLLLMALVAVAVAVLGRAAEPRILAGVVFLILVAAGLLSLSHLAAGVTLRDIARKAERVTAGHSNDWLTRHFGPHQDPIPHDHQ